MKVLIVGEAGQGKSDLALEVMKQKHSDDITLVISKEEETQGLNISEKNFKITSAQPMQMASALCKPLSGREKRKKRREYERKAKKKRT